MYHKILINVQKRGTNRIDLILKIYTFLLEM
jgi:hypothetical protein